MASLLLLFEALIINRCHDHNDFPSQMVKETNVATSHNIEKTKKPFSSGELHIDGSVCGFFSKNEDVHAWKLPECCLWP